ncbi:hypothetical protein J1N35_037616, partial [Gossypium stocksii]
MDKRSASGKEMATVTTRFEHVAIIPKFKRRKVSVIRDFPPGCGRGAITDFRLNRQIAVDQGKYSCPPEVTNEVQYLNIGSDDRDYLVLYVI